MKESPGQGTQTALGLKQAFDRGFAERASPVASAYEDLLMVHIGGFPYAIRVSEIAGLYAEREVVPIPSTTSELLGIAGFRNALFPVYDLRLLLGHPNGSMPRWLVVTRGTEPVGLAFDLFEGHLRATPEQVSVHGVREGTPLTWRTVRTDVVRPIIDIASLLEVISRRAQPGGAIKES